MSEYLSQTELGKLFGATSHQVGKWLADCGLRNEWKKPSKRAFDEGFVTTTSTNRGSQGGYYYVWNREKSVAALQAAGHRLRPHFDPQIDGRLKGPFQARKGSVNGFELADAEGNVAIFVMGQKNAQAVVALLNLATMHGRFRGETK